MADPELPSPLEPPPAPEIPSAEPTKTEPIISGGVFKALGVLLVAAALGFGGYVLGNGGLDVNLPEIDLEDITSTTEQSTNFSDTTLENTTIGEGTEEEVEAASQNPLSSAGFAFALERVRAEAGAEAELTEVALNDVQSQFVARRGNDVEAYSVRADSGEVSRQTATITISGNATLADFAFPLAGVDAGAVDRMLARAKKLSGAADFAPTTLILDRDLSSGRRPPEWTINAEGGGRNLTYRAAENGKRVRDIGGGGTEIPQAALDAKKLNECISGAQQNIEAIQACFEQFSGG